jgi:hypothetical protein
VRVWGLPRETGAWWGGNPLMWGLGQWTCRHWSPSQTARVHAALGWQPCWLWEMVRGAWCRRAPVSRGSRLPLVGVLRYLPPRSRRWVCTRAPWAHVLRPPRVRAPRARLPRIRRLRAVCARVGVPRVCLPRLGSPVSSPALLSPPLVLSLLYAPLLSFPGPLLFPQPAPRCLVVRLSWLSPPLW